MSKVVNVAIMLLIAALILPVALSQFSTASTAGWQSNWVTVFNMMPIMALLALVIGVIYMVKARSDSKGG